MIIDQRAKASIVCVHPSRINLQRSRIYIGTRQYGCCSIDPQHNINTCWNCTPQHSRCSIDPQHNLSTWWKISKAWAWVILTCAWLVYILCFYKTCSPGATCSRKWKVHRVFQSIRIPEKSRVIHSSKARPHARFPDKVKQDENTHILCIPDKVPAHFETICCELFRGSSCQRHLRSHSLRRLVLYVSIDPRENPLEGLCDHNNHCSSRCCCSPPGRECLQVV